MSQPMGTKQRKILKTGIEQSCSAPITNNMDNFTRELAERRILEKLANHEELWDHQKEYVTEHDKLIYESTGNAISEFDPEFSKNIVYQ